MYFLAAIPFVLAACWLLVFLVRLLRIRAVRLTRESQITFYAGLCEYYAARAAAAPRLSSEWVQHCLEAERMATKAFEVLSSRRPAALHRPPVCVGGGAAERVGGRA